MATHYTAFDPGAPAGERADAARNRQAILDAASALFDEYGADRVTVDQIADAAGVGKGTIYRRFTDRSGLALALLDQSDRELQHSILRGPPPLGPGAPAGERLEAFVGALADFLEEHVELMCVAEGGPEGVWFRSNVYASYRLHVEVLLREDRPDADCATLADVVLAPLGAGLYRHLRFDRGLDPARIRSAAVEAATRIVGARFGA
jgi:AcrR family transcriptional regulator